MNEDRTHYLYRGFDGYGLLLYVGCTVNPDQRLATHRSSSPWYRFAECLGVGGQYASRSEALLRERQAIDTEAPYFNASVADMRRTNANLVAAKKSLWARGDFEAEFLGDVEDIIEESPEFQAYMEAGDAWCRRRDAERARLKAGAYWYMTAEDRLQRYLAAREDAALAGAA